MKPASSPTSLAKNRIFLQLVEFFAESVEFELDTLFALLSSFVDARKWAYSSQPGRCFLRQGGFALCEFRTLMAVSVSVSHHQGQVQQVRPAYLLMTLQLDLYYLLFLVAV